MSIFGEAEKFNSKYKNDTSNGGRKRKREEAENELLKIKNKIREIKELQLLPLKEQLEQQKEIIGSRRYEENNPYIRLLDPHFNYLIDIIKICLSYLPVDYCAKCNDFFPANLQCFSCMEHKNDDEFYYEPYGSFSILRKSRGSSGGLKIAIVEFHCENDIVFMDYLNHKVPLTADDKYMFSWIDKKDPIKKDDPHQLVVSANSKIGLGPKDASKYKFCFRCDGSEEDPMCEDFSYSVFLQKSN